MSPSAPRLVWITGAGKGIGRALALLLARDGDTVAVSARTEEDLLSLRREAEETGARIIPFTLDVTDHTATAETVVRIEDTLGPMGLAVLIGGPQVPLKTAEFSVSPFRRLIEVNLMGTVNCLDALLPGMRRRGAGRIAVVASLAGYRGLPTSSAYGASKAGLINMCEALQPDLERDGIDLRLINPGFVKTPLTDMNDFPMPFLISAEEAADAIRRGLAGSAFEIAFPGQFAFLMRLLRILPDRLFFALTRRIMPDA